MTVVGCTGLLSPVCQGVSGVGSGVAGASAGAVLGAVTTWVVQGASWLLGQIAGALTSSTSVDLGAGWFAGQYQVMAGLAAVVVLPMLLMAAVQAVYRQSAAVLVRVVAVQLPLALVLTGVAVQLVQLSLAATDALGATVSSGAGTDVQQALQGVAVQLVAQAGGGPDSAPAFVVMLGALLVAFAAFLLWLELLVRAAAVYAAVLFLPMALASLVWPAVSHWCRRLVETLVALVLTKFVIVAILSLAAAALASGTGTGFSSVLGGGALLLLAAFTPFTLLRLVPMVEAGAVQQLEGARHRVAHALASAPRSAAHHALRSSGPQQFATGEPGTGVVPDFGVPGDGEPGLPGGAPPASAGGAAGPGGGRRPGGGKGPGGGRGGVGAASGRTPGGGPAPGDADEELPGLPGIPPWRGTVPVLDGTGTTLPPPPPGGPPDDPYGRGPIPVKGAPPAAPAPPASEPGTGPPAGPTSGSAATPAAGPEPALPGAARDEPGQALRWTSMTFRHDEYGPVITGWDRAVPGGPRGGTAGGAPGVAPGPGGGDHGGGGGA